jgi:hypothetical protein
MHNNLDHEQLPFANFVCLYSACSVYIVFSVFPDESNPTRVNQEMNVQGQEDENKLSVCEPY